MAERLVDVQLVTAELRGARQPGQNPTYGVYRAWRAESSAFEDLAAYSLAQPVLMRAGTAERVSVTAVESHTFYLLGAYPAVGRLFSSGEDTPTDLAPAILSHAFWVNYFGGDPAIVGRRLVLGGRSYHVVGVMPSQFRFPVLPYDIGHTETQIWVPLASFLRPDSATSRGDNSPVWVVGRTRPDVALEIAEGELDRISEARGLLTTNDRWRFSEVVPLRRFVVGGVRGPLALMQGAAAFVLLVGCASAANLLLVRGLAREREFAVRTALGARPRRLLRQLVTESLLLAIAAGIAGVLLAVWSTPVLVQMGTGELPELGTIRVGIGPLTGAVVVTVATGILFGIVPALYAYRTSSVVLRQGSRNGGRSWWRSRITDGLVVAQVALAMILLAGAVSLSYSFVRLVRVDLGFDPEQILIARVSPPDDGSWSASELAAFAQTTIGSVQSVAGVSSAAVATASPFMGGSFSVVNKPGTDITLGSRPAWLVAAREGYFALLGIPLIRGTTLDGANPNAVIIDEAAAHEFFPQTDPIGQSLSWRSNQERGTVVGIVGNVRQGSLEDAPVPHIYMPLAGSNWARSLQILISTEQDPRRHEGVLREAISGIDPTLVVDEVTTMTELLGDSLARQRFYTMLLVLFGAVALVIAVGGVYATASYSAAGTVRDLGVRAALGAQRSHLFTAVARRAVALTILGGSLGLAGAFFSMRAMEGLLFHVTPGDPIALGVAFALLCGASLGACYIPGRRAMRTDPSAVLRPD